jgi:hypothetical protein
VLLLELEHGFVDLPDVGSDVDSGVGVGGVRGREGFGVLVWEMQRGAGKRLQEDCCWMCPM